MRKALLFIVASGVVVLFWATRIWFLAVSGAGVLVAVGGYLQWEDFIAPVLGIEVKK